MKQNSLIILVIALSIQSLFGQRESFFGLSLGASLPQENYSEMTFSDISGYANTGFLFTFDATFFPDDYLGIGTTVTYGSNNTDNEKYQSDLTNYVFGEYPILEDYEDDLLFDIGSWRYLNFHAGPNFTVAAGRFNFDMRAMAGLSVVWSSGHSLELDHPDYTYLRQMPSDAVPTIGYTLGSGVRYALKSGYVFRVIFEYSNSKPTLELTEQISTDLGSDEEFQTREIEMPVKNLQVGIGIAYNFEL